ncbi:MAG: hypothetical protein PHH61_06340 [Candidatus Nanoarchaeia archaeon]|nr:hypothetical protein [Candidatus Nanoarchaeia archaeon]
MVALKDKVKGKINTKRKSLGIVLIILYFLFVFFFLWNTLSISGEIADSTSQRTFLVPINMNLNGTRGFYQTDIRIGLNFTYPRGTLIVDETINIIGIAFLESERTKNISLIAISFENCLSSGKYDQFGLPKQAFLIFNNSETTSGLVINQDTGRFGKLMCDDVDATWSIDGSYHPIIGIFYNDNTNTTMTIDDIVIHVYPKEQLTQIQTNIVTVILSIAVFLLSFFGVLDLFLNFWNYESQKCNYPKNCSEESKPKTQPKQNQTNGEICENAKTVSHNHKPTTNNDKK